MRAAGYPANGGESQGSVWQSMVRCRYFHVDYVRRCREPFALAGCGRMQMVLAPHGQAGVLDPARAGTAGTEATRLLLPAALESQVHPREEVGVLLATLPLMRDAWPAKTRTRGTAYELSSRTDRGRHLEAAQPVPRSPGAGCANCSARIKLARAVHPAMAYMSLTEPGVARGRTSMWSRRTVSVSSARRTSRVCSLGSPSRIADMRRETD